VTAVPAFSRVRPSSTLLRVPLTVSSPRETVLPGPPMTPPVHTKDSVTVIAEGPPRKPSLKASRPIRASLTKVTLPSVTLVRPVTLYSPPI
jgi:hypothetical protein